MKKIHELDDGSKMIDGRSMPAGTGGVPSVRLIPDTGFQPKEMADVYQHEDGYAIIVKQGLFEVSNYKNGKIYIKKL